MMGADEVMLEGKIIKFYRERKNMTQKELGDGICSITHVSKIERGLTEVSKETIQFLAGRLEIDIESEIKTYKGLDTLLKKWEEAIIMKLHAKAETLKQQLEEIALLQIPDFYRSHTLLLARFYLMTGDHTKAQSIIQEMDKWQNPTPLDKNMILHIKGIYGLQCKHDYLEAIELLKQIDPTHYHNTEYYYHLAVAYHSINSRVLAYYYASMALRFFEKAHCYVRVIETEMLMLIQVGHDTTCGPQDVKYEQLIEMCDNFGLTKQKALLLHNYGYHCILHENFEKACEYYHESMNLKDPSTPEYIGSLEGFINASVQLGKKSKNELISLAEKGLKLSKDIDSTTFTHFFQLHYYRLTEQDERYYDYLEKEMYPHLKKLGYVLPSEHYEIKLFDYHMEKDNIQKANEYAMLIADKNRRINHFV
jgi:HTH-type transcriptional regulator, quorum sensing regulator NprR